MYANLYTNNYAYCTNLGFEGDQNFPGFQCVSGNCIMNDSFPGVSFCPSEIKSEDSQSCIFKSKNRPQSIDQYNVLTLYDKNKATAQEYTL